MANICYTKYKVEGSVKEVEALRRALNKREGKKLTSYLRYCRLAPLTEASVKRFPNSGEVLSFETATKWGPELGEWTDIIRKWAPHAQIVYYAEEFWCGVHETNDIWGKYFPRTYAVHIRLSDKTPEKVRKVFTRDAEYRDREDQWGWFSYLSPAELGERIRAVLPGSPGCTWSLFDQFEARKKELLFETATTIVIGSIRREEDPMIKNGPCWYCEERKKQLDEILSLYDELHRYERRFGPLPKEGWELPAYPRR